MYKLINSLAGTPESVEVVGENKIIPFDPANTDYQAYQAWLAEGNEPLPAN